MNPDAAEAGPRVSDRMRLVGWDRKAEYSVPQTLRTLEVEGSATIGRILQEVTK